MSHTPLIAEPSVGDRVTYLVGGIRGAVHLAEVVEILDGDRVLIRDLHTDPGPDSTPHTLVRRWTTLLAPPKED